MTRDRMGAAWMGLSLIGLGVVLLLAQVIGWSSLWPLFPIFGGVMALIGWFVSGFKDSGLVFVGIAGTLVGLFFFGFTLGYWEWGEMSTLWPAFPLIGGVAFFALFLAERGRDMGALSVGCAAVIVGVVGFGVTMGFLGTDIVKLWPLLLVLIGLITLVSGLVRMFRRE